MKHILRKLFRGIAAVAMLPRNDNKVWCFDVSLKIFAAKEIL